MSSMIKSLLFLGCLFLAVPVSAKSTDEPFDFGGEIRLRSETLVGFDSFIPARTAVDDNSFVLMRVRVFGEAKPTENLHIFLQPQFSRSFAQEGSTVANTANVDDLDLHQGYIDILKINGSPLSLRLGRMELSYGDERLLGAFGWSNVGRSHDGARARLEWDGLWIDGFFSWIQVTAGNQYLGGLYGHWDIHDTLHYEPSFILLRDNDGGSRGGTLTVHTLGNRLYGGFGESWDFDLSGALQLGESGPFSLLAFAAHSDLGYTFSKRWKPRIALEYNIASGDDRPAAGRVKTFNNLFPTNHGKYGYMDLVGWRNIHNARFTIGLTPSTKIKISLDYHAFLLMEPADGLYQASGAQVRAGTNGASRYVGSEADLLLKYDWNRWAKFLFGYSFFKAGSFLSTAGLKQDAHFLYAQTTATF